MVDQNKEKYPNVLIISNNPLSDTSNNGKTIASFFKDYPPKSIQQLYFSGSYPTGYKINSYYQITDRRMLQSIFNKGLETGDRVEKTKNNIAINKTEKKIKKNEFTRLLRELVWFKGKWKKENFFNWLDEFKPEVIFFVAGDSVFAYKVVEYLREKYSTKLITYVTDDYILPRKTLNPFWWIRRNLILKNMNKVLKNTDIFITISKKMKEVYKEIFSKDSLYASNQSENMFLINRSLTEQTPLRIIYAGGLHYKRFKTINLIAKAIKSINEKAGIPLAKLDIYTNSKPHEEILEEINISGSSNYRGSLDKSELIYELNNSDILLHVESFDLKSIEATRLSVSTKINEYISIEKPILAVGPAEIASMEFLSNIAYCITDNALETKLRKIIINKHIRENLVEKVKDYNENNINNKFSDELINLILELKINNHNK